jgi:DNA mismatch repair protein MutS
VEDTHHNLLAHITKIQIIPQEDYLMMDNFTLRNLEIVYPSNPQGKSLLDIIDKTSTPMGGRLLRRRIILPLKSVDEINRRLALIDFLTKTIILNMKFPTFKIDFRFRPIDGKTGGGKNFTERIGISSPKFN